MVADEGDYVVRCFEGTVAVTSVSNLSDTVTAGEGIRLVGDAWEALQVEEKDPAWINGFTSFENAPIREVLNAYERQFGIEVIYNNDNRKYTGAFPHDNANDALEMIALPMNLVIESGDSGEIHLRRMQE